MEKPGCIKPYLQIIEIIDALKDCISIAPKLTLDDSGLTFSWKSERDGKWLEKTIGLKQKLTQEEIDQLCADVQNWMKDN